MRTLLTVLFVVAVTSAANAKDLVFAAGADKLEIAGSAIEQVAAGYSRSQGDYLEIKLGKAATRSFAEFTKKHNGKVISTRVGDMVVSKGIRIREMITGGELKLSGLGAKTIADAYHQLRQRMTSPKRR
jgi:preprotein translocase subunit SecD